MVADRARSSTLPKAPPSTLGRPRLALHVVYPPALAGQQILLQDQLVIGREDPNAGTPRSGASTLVDATISRRHALVTLGPSGFLVEDTGSRNGTSVNGAPAKERMLLLPQMVVRMGDVLAVVAEASTESFDASLALPGTAQAISDVRARMHLAAKDGGAVLIVGETGTGKERLAAEVHRLSGRQGTYVAVNCAELSGTLMESQLFGHERGAFTGASSSRAGLFAAADGGTLFLDEVGEIPMDLQAKLLRALEEQQIRPVGSVQTRPVDVRVIAATNRDLRHSVERGTFRRDLYARLSLWELRLPSLRQRRQDVLAWLDYLAALWNQAHGQLARLSLMPDAAERILCHPWLDNVRGLNNLVHRLASIGYDRSIGVRVLNEAMPELFQTPSAAPDVDAAAARMTSDVPEAPPASRTTARERASGSPGRPSREELIAVFEANQRSVRATSKHYGRDRRQIYRWLESYGIGRGQDP